MTRAEVIGSEETPPPYQRELGEEGPVQVSWFKAQTSIWPVHGRMGYLCEPINAHPINQKVKGLKGFRACTKYTLYYDGEHHTFCANTTFGAYSKNEHVQILNEPTKSSPS